MSTRSPLPVVVPSDRMTIDQFFTWAERQERKYELIDGVPHLLPYVKLNHARIVTRLATMLHVGLEASGFEVTSGDFAVEVGLRSVRFADVMVIPAGKPGETLRVTDAVVLIEVLSDSTMQVDFGPKLMEYQALQTLDTYLIFSQSEAKVWRWSRNQQGKWPTTSQIMSSGTIRIEKISADLSVDSIYNGLFG